MGARIRTAGLFILLTGIFVGFGWIIGTVFFGDWLSPVVQRVAAMNQLPMPRVYIVPAAAPNAFATGRNPKHAVVAVTEGALRVLNERELTAVIAHEMAHVRDRDILVMSVAATIAGALTILAR